MSKKVNNILTPNSSNEKIMVDFSQFPYLFSSVEYNDFTNYLSDCFEFFDKLKYIFEKLIPFVSNHTYNDINGASKHSHPITNGSKEMKLVENIIKEKLKKDYRYEENDINNFFVNNINDYQMWQIGLDGDVRIIGIRYINRFKPIFIDYHHLIFPDKNYNQRNYKKFNFCPVNGGCKYEK